MPGIRSHDTGETESALSEIAGKCGLLGSKKSRGDLGAAIAAVVLAYSPRDLHQMRWNFSEKIRNIDPVYRKHLEETITGHLHGTYQNVRLMDQQGVFLTMREPVVDGVPEYWKMAAENCTTGEEEEDRLRFLKFLLAGFCMFVQGLPGHPVGMEFPGGDKVDVIDGVCYCPVRTKANDVDAALCPFCPALQTPEIGYLRPPVNASGHRKQEFIRNCYDFHNFNG
ncbi:MAG: DUF2115 domain-containing protein [Methanoregula sp.]|nr:MAG: DUF2115 domain-containing protein [Methanoregula sp.]